MNNVNNEADIIQADEHANLVNNVILGVGENPRNNPNNNQQRNPNTSDTGIKSKAILEFSRDFFPAIIFISLVMFSLSLTDKYCDQYFPIILRSSMYFQFGFLFKSISFMVILLFFKTRRYLKYSIIAYDYIIYIAYYIFIIAIYNIYKNIQNLDECVHMNPFHSVVIFTIITLGIFDIFRHIFSFLQIVIGFPVLVYHFFKDPREFIHRYGIDPELIDTWPTITATCEHAIECIICSEEIREAQQIMILNCQGRHFYHATCIKEWLKVKLNCPVCRSTNVF